ncbi:MAG TPA: Rieske 2Fe-2S domain-containing protein [Chloroflexota bacterium]
MLTQEENELLTRTGPGTPCGDLMRRYWQPVALAEELPVGGAPLPVRLLGEDLVLFRTPGTSPLEGRGEGEGSNIGCLAIHCSHRGADLSYGRLEDGGLRCIYHGWLYDIHGRCLEQPGEPAGSSFHEKIRHIAYPCQEVAGLILAYLGPGEPPLIPGFDPLRAPDDHRFNTKVFRECNYLQGNEGNMDAVHSAFLHWQHPRWRSPAGFDAVDSEPTNYGLRNYWIQHLSPERSRVHINNFLMPNLSAIGGGVPGREGFGLNWHVPIDDTHHWVYVINFHYHEPIDSESRRTNHAELGLDYRIVRNRANRYQQDREQMKTTNFAGLGTYYYLQDGCVTEGAGPTQDRTHENLGFGDAAIKAGRQMLREAIADVQEGRDPLGVVRDPTENHFEVVMTWEEIPRDRSWRGYWRDQVGANA